MIAWPRVKPGSQASGILDVLADRHWHTTREIHRRAGYSRLNSRIAELNNERGYTIHHRGEGAGTDAHEYLLVSVPLAEPARESVPRVAEWELAVNPPQAAGDLGSLAREFESRRPPGSVSGATSGPSPDAAITAAAPLEQLQLSLAVAA